MADPRTDAPYGDAAIGHKPAKELLLWLHGRVDLDTSAVPEALLDRFRAITFTD